MSDESFYPESGSEGNFNNAHRARRRSGIDFSSIIGAVARHLLGEPNPGLSTKDDLRFGTKGSLSVNLKKGVWHDHESDEGGGCLDLIRRQISGDPIKWLREQRLIEDDTLAYTFDCPDEHSTLLYQVCRTAAGRPWVRRPDSHGGWINKIEGVRRVLYRLPELLASTGIVFIPEGEKHVDRLYRLGLTATCNPFGAGPGKWLRQYNDSLRGRDVVILSDNDAPGIQHAQNIARNLTGFAARVRVLMLPGLKPKGDVINWLDDGGTIEELVRLVEACPTWEETAPPEDGERTLIRTSAEFVADFKPPDYLIDGLIQRRFLYSMTAPTNIGKTAIALCLAFHVAQGENLGSREVVKGRVLYLAGENPDDVRMRWIKMCTDFDLEPADVDVRFVPGSYRLSQIRNQIQTESATHGPFVLVIVDTSVAYSDTEDENDNVQMGKYARTLRSLIQLPDGPTIIVTCHPPKHVIDPDDFLPRGGGSYVAEMDTNLICMKEPHGQLVLLHWRRKIRGVDFAPVPFGIQYGTTERLKDSRGRMIYTVTARLFSAEEHTREEERMVNDEDRVLVLIRDRPTLSMTAMAEALDWRYPNGEANKSRVQRITTKLRRDKLIKEARRGVWKLTPQGAAAADEIAIRTAERNPAETTDLFQNTPRKP